MHSYLGETIVFPRLFALPNLPLLRRDRTYTVNVLRYAWHMTSVAWWAGGAILAALWWGRGDLRQTVLMIVAGMLLFTGLDHSGDGRSAPSRLAAVPDRRGGRLVRRLIATARGK